MTMNTWLPELEEELRPPPVNPLKVSRHMWTKDPGFAEIKKHNTAGLTEGLAQLGFTGYRRAANRAEPPQLQRYLITYVPVRINKQNGSETPDETTTATDVHVYTVRFDDVRAVPRTVDDLLLRRRWIDLGTIPIPPGAFAPPSTPGTFGIRIEEPVRRHFIKCVVKHKYPRKPWNIDLVWNELAEFYSELAQELGSAASSFRF